MRTARACRRDAWPVYRGRPSRSPDAPPVSRCFDLDGRSPPATAKHWRYPVTRSARSNYGSTRDAARAERWVPAGHERRQADGSSPHGPDLFSTFYGSARPDLSSERRQGPPGPTTRACERQRTVRLPYARAHARDLAQPSTPSPVMCSISGHTASQVALSGAGGRSLEVSVGRGSRRWQERRRAR